MQKLHKSQSQSQSAVHNTCSAVSNDNTSLVQQSKMDTRTLAFHEGVDTAATVDTVDRAKNLVEVATGKSVTAEVYILDSAVYAIAEKKAAKDMTECLGRDVGTHSNSIGFYHLGAIYINHTKISSKQDVLHFACHEMIHSVSNPAPELPRIFIEGFTEYIVGTILRKNASASIEKPCGHREYYPMAFAIAFDVFDAFGIDGYDAMMQALFDRDIHSLRNLLNARGGDGTFEAWYGCIIQCNPNGIDAHSNNYRKTASDVLTRPDWKTVLPSLHSPGFAMETKKYIDQAVQNNQCRFPERTRTQKPE